MGLVLRRKSVMGLTRATLAALILVLSHVTASAAKWPATWNSTELVNHPLVGKIYATEQNGRFVQPNDYLALIADWPQYVLLGEVHDNPDHHRLQALAIERMGQSLAAVVFEQFTSDQQPVLNAFRTETDLMQGAAGDDVVERLFLVTQWGKSGWPDKSIYQPLMSAAIASNGKLIAGNPPRGRVRDVARRGIDALSADALRQMRLDRPLGGVLDDALLTELEASHCGLMPKSAFTNMALAQRLRDAHMARALADAATSDRKVVLIAGNGHVGSDRGVPWYLDRIRQSTDTASVISVRHIEVEAGKSDPRDYLDQPNRSVADSNRNRTVEYIVFTPRMARTDPCIEMRKRFGQKTK